MLENLTPADTITVKNKVRPGIEFDGDQGEAVTPGYETEPQNFDEFLLDAGLDPSNIEVIPPVRTSRWQQQKEGELIWLTSYRFTFRKKTSNIDLPLILSEAKKKSNPKPLKTTNESALILLWSDLQVGKVDYRGNSQDLIDRVELTKVKIMDLIKREKPKKVIFVDLGDTVENFENKASQQQLQSNDLSIMEQVDLATTLAWQTIRQIAERVPTVIYASVGSNHCQWRKNGQAIGKATDDWGVFIGRQLARLASETNTDNIRFIEPQPHDESLALDVFDNGFHILGIVHGHQANRPDNVATWWRQQAFGNQPVSNANILVHGHFHHLRVLELGGISRDHGTTSRYLISASTLDNGSNWFRNISGEDSQPGLVSFTLQDQIDFTGTVWKL